MKLLNNIHSTHYNEINTILNGADELNIVSPFLMESFDDFFSRIKEKNIKHISLTTTLKDNSPDLLKKSNALYSFCINCKKENISYCIHIDNKLHGKIYISLVEGLPLKAIITSANFTTTGLEKNHEWGVLIEDANQIEMLINEIYSVNSEALSSEEIENIIKKIDDFSKVNSEQKETKIDLIVSDIFERKRRQKVNSDKRYFIKPVGVSNDPFPENRSMSHNIQKLHFSKRRPASVRVGDILICYAVGTTKLLGYFEIIEGPYYLEGSTSRWPWEVKIKNLCPDYSAQWTNFNNTISSIQSTYNLQVPITNAGGENLNALRRGLDRIQLTEEFASHVINIIEDSI